MNGDHEWGLPPVAGYQGKGNDCEAVDGNCYRASGVRVWLSSPEDNFDAWIFHICRF